MKKLILGSLIAASLGAALPAAAHSNVGVVLNFGPPPVRYEVIPAPRAGWVWVPGAWVVRHHRYRWMAGHWVRHRPAYVYTSVYAPPRRVVIYR